jgi:energy-coupling factor transporter ATP-binding protein EcfA2
VTTYPHSNAIATPLQRHAFLVFEGLDGCGKTRQARRTASILREFGHRVCLTGEPTGFSTDKRPNVIGELARRVLRGDVTIHDARALQLVYAADRLEHVASTIQPALDSGEIVVCDRYDLSTLLYGMASVSEFACASGCGWHGSEDDLQGVGVNCPRCNGLGLDCIRDNMASWLRAVGRYAQSPQGCRALRR